MSPIRWNKNDYFISTDISLLDMDYTHHYLCHQSYWAKDVPIDVVKRSIENSVCFGVFENNRQIGFGRVITDKATFGYLCDIFIDPDYRGRGLSKWLVQTMLDHPELQGFRNWVLGTLDAHSLYEKFGFIVHPEPQRMMRKNNPDCYKKKDVIG